MAKLQELLLILRGQHFQNVLLRNALEKQVLLGKPIHSEREQLLYLREKVDAERIKRRVCDQKEINELPQTRARHRGKLYFAHEEIVSCLIKSVQPIFSNSTEQLQRTGHNAHGCPWAPMGSPGWDLAASCLGIPIQNCYAPTAFSRLLKQSKAATAAFIRMRQIESEQGSEAFTQKAEHPGCSQEPGAKRGGEMRGQGVLGLLG